MIVTHLKVALVQRGVTAADLGVAVGWSRAGRYVHRVMRREEHISEAKADLIAKWLGVARTTVFKQIEGPNGKPRYLAISYGAAWRPPW